MSDYRVRYKKLGLCRVEAYTSNGEYICTYQKGREIETGEVTWLLYELDKDHVTEPGDFPAFLAWAAAEGIA